MFPFPRTDLFHGLCDRYAERGVAVQDGDPDLELRNLTVEVPRHEPLAHQFHAMHLRFDATSAVVSAPSSPERAAKIFRSAQGLVTSHGSGGDRSRTLKSPYVPARCMNRLARTTDSGRGGCR